MRKCNSINTPLKAIDSMLPSISVLKKSIDSDTIQAYIEAWIVNLVKFLNLGKSMNEDQIFETASMIILEYYMLNLADINNIFRNAKMGKYGIFYDRIDGMIILSFFEKYCQERAQNASEREISRSYEFKGENCPTFDKITELSNKKRF